jgi:hypothetical protein
VSQAHQEYPAGRQGLVAYCVEASAAPGCVQTTCASALLLTVEKQMFTLQPAAAMLCQHTMPCQAVN